MFCPLEARMFIISTITHSDCRPVGLTRYNIELSNVLIFVTVNMHMSVLAYQMCRHVCDICPPTNSHIQHELSANYRCHNESLIQISNGRHV
jgi:hypothetical protein